jgi:hypothetical protein
VIATDLISQRDIEASYRADKPQVSVVGYQCPRG